MNCANQPVISVVIPCYNCAHYLPEALDSVLKQTYPPLEIIVVDDGSTDNSGQIAASYGPPVRVVRQPNQGQSVARNRGVDEAKGEWIAFLDADDLWEPDKLRLQVETLRDISPEVGCVYTHLYILRDGQRLDIPELPQYHLLERPYLGMLCHPSIHPSSALVRREAASRVRFDPSHRQHEDTLFFISLRADWRFLYVPRPLLGYRLASEGAGVSLTTAHRYWIEGAWTRYCYARERPHLFSDEELLQVRKKMLEILVSRHDTCYMLGDFVACERAKEIAAKIALNDLRIPRRMFRPRWLAPYYRLRRKVGATLKRAFLGVPRV